MNYLLKYRIYDNETETLGRYLYKTFSSKEDVIIFLDNIRKGCNGEFIIYKSEQFICDDVYDIF